MIKLLDTASRTLPIHRVHIFYRNREEVAVLPVVQESAQFTADKAGSYRAVAVYEGQDGEPLLWGEIWYGYLLKGDVITLDSLSLEVSLLPRSGR